MIRAFRIAAHPIEAGRAGAETLLDVTTRNDIRAFAAGLQRRCEDKGMFSHDFVSALETENAQDGGVHFQKLLLVMQHDALDGGLEERAMFFFGFA